MSAAVAEAALIAANRLRGPQLGLAVARAQVVELCTQWMAATGHGGRKGIASFCATYPDLPIEPRLRELIPTVSESTLYRWRSDAEKGLAQLAPRWKGRQATIDKDEELSAVMKGLVATKPRLRGRQAWQLLEALDPALAAKVSEDTVRRWLERWRAENHQTWLRAVDPDAAKGRLQPAVGRADENVVRLNQLWEMDATPADVMLLDDEGKPRRHSLVGVIDIYTRRVRLLVAPTSRAETVNALLRRALLDWGVPESVRTDNGKDFVAVAVQEVFRALEIEPLLCAPFASEQKPFIERFWRTFSHDVLEYLPGYLGHDVAERKQIEAVKAFAERLGTQGAEAEAALTCAQMQEFCDTVTELRYGRRVHSSLGCSPWDRWRSWTQPVRKVANERALDLLLTPSETRTVQKDGIRIDGRTFWAEELVERIGGRVLVQRDLTDAGRLIVLDEHREFVCVAINPELAGVARQELAARARARSKDVQRESREWAKQHARELEKRLEGKDLYELQLERDRRLASEVTALPRPSVPYETPALAAAAAAVAANDALAVTPAPAPIPLRPQLAAVPDEDDALNEKAWTDYLALEELGSKRTAQQTRRLLQLRGLPFIQGRAAQLRAATG